MIAFIIFAVIDAIVLYIIVIMLLCNGSNVYNKDEKSILKASQKESDFKESLSESKEPSTRNDDDDFHDFDFA